MINTSNLRKIEGCKGKLKDLIGNEGILKLANEGLCPHYIITNPITKEETIWFMSSEINTWLENNYIKYNKGYDSQNYTFFHFNNNVEKAKLNVPAELSKINDLYHLPIQDINTPPGIYFLCKNDKIQYIGQSVNVASRVMQHIREGMKDFDNVFFITCNVSRLTELESSLIKYLTPPLNKKDNLNLNQNHIMIAESILS